MRKRVECAEDNLKEANTNIYDLESNKAKAKVDMAAIEREIESLKTEITHLEDSWAKSLDEIFHNIME